jgi:hypothetical protein
MRTPNVEDRILVLERQVVRQQGLIAAMLCVCLVISVGVSFDRVWAAGEDVPDVVKAKSFLVVDDSGSVLAEMTTRGDAGLISTYTAEDATQTALGSDDEGGGYITCFNKEGDVQVNLGGDDGGGQVITYAASTDPRVVISGDENGGFVSTFNAESTPTRLE